MRVRRLRSPIPGGPGEAVPRTVSHDAGRPEDTDLAGVPDAQRLLLPALRATLAALGGRQVLDIGGRAGLISGTPVIRAADPLRLPWPTAYFDGVLSLDLLGLLAPDEVSRHLIEAARVLRPGGRLICVVTEQLDTVFTAAGVDPEQARSGLADALAACSTAEAPAAMLSVPGILRASAIDVAGELRLPARDAPIAPGTPAWTRLPDSVVRHRVYAIDDILRAAPDARLSAVSVERHVDPAAGRAGSLLGSAYRTCTPFAMVHLVRREGRLDSPRPRLGRGSGAEPDATSVLR